MTVILFNVYIFLPSLFLILIFDNSGFPFIEWSVYLSYLADVTHSVKTEIAPHSKQKQRQSQSKSKAKRSEAKLSFCFFFLATYSSVPAAS